MGRRAKAAAILGLLGPAGCPRFEEPLACAPDLSCPDGLICSESARLCCPPLRCEGRCGVIRDACGATLDCACDSCTPIDCELAGARCGRVDDGCGSPLYCGACGGGEYCDGERVCVKNSACLTLAECGPLPAAIHCGGCEVGEACLGEVLGRCEPRDREAQPLCWGPLLPLVPGSTVAHRVFPVYEGSLLWLYSETDAYRPEHPGCTRHARYLQLQPGTTALGSLHALRSSELPTHCPTGTVACSGTAGVPFVRRDGLEMFFVANYPCNDEASRHLYLSWRETTGHPWSAPRMIRTGSSTSGRTLGAPLLLPDDRTLIYSQDAPGWRVLRRETVTPGDATFVEDREPSSFIDVADPPSDGRLYEMNPESITCDGRYLVYSRSYRPDAYDLRMVELLPSRPGEGPRFGRPFKHSDYPSALPFPRKVVESPDCAQLYVRTRDEQLYAPRVACPE